MKVSSRHTKTADAGRESDDREWNRRSRGGTVAFGAVQKSDKVGMGDWRHVGGRNNLNEYQFLGYARTSMHLKARRRDPLKVRPRSAQC